MTTLTKRMAESRGILYGGRREGHYLHSEILTLERIKILRDLRRGCLTCWWASTCSAKGWTCRSVAGRHPGRGQGRLSAFGAFAIQTIGRAARNADGKAILYADKITKSCGTR